MGKPIKFVALKPIEVVERVKRNLVVNAHEKSKRLDELKNDDVLSELSALFDNGIKFVEPSDLSGSLRGRQNMYNHLDMMIRGAEKVITIATTADGLNRKMEALLPCLERAKRRGCVIRIAAPITEGNIKVARQIAKFAEVRDTSQKSFNGRFAIIDSEQLMFMLTNDSTVHPNYDVAVWISTDFFAKVMEQMFELTWKEFRPLNKVKVRE